MKLTRYQWMVLFAAWLGWGFDIFDGLLFNYVAPNCVPTLLGLTIGSPEAKAATLYWTGLITSALLIGWAIGGIVFGYIADRIGRTKTLLLTMLLYALGTASCAFVPNIQILLFFRLIASLGIGGEWAAGAAMVAEVMPKKYRVEAGALLYTSASMGLFLASSVNYLVSRVLFSANPEISWRYVFLAGLIPASFAISIRFFIKEPEAWQSQKGQKPPAIQEIFAPGIRKATLSGLSVSVIALLTWWSCNSFMPVVASGLAQVAIKAQDIPIDKVQMVIEDWKTSITNSFNIGGLIGTLLTIPAAKILGRKWMFGIYFVLSSLAVTFTFGVVHNSNLVIWCWLYFAIGLTVFGIFGSFTFYLPELFPTRLRATGSGFCYNAGRIITAIGPFLVGQIASGKTNVLQGAFGVLFIIGFIPLVGIALMPWVIETKSQQIDETSLY